MATFTVWGDSHTSYLKPTLEEGLATTGCWPSYAEGHELTLAGGWAKAGATSADILANVYEIPADIAIIMVGTNDITDDVPNAVTAANIHAIGLATGADRVLVLANPPRTGGRATKQKNLNTALAATFGIPEGWDFYDPWTVQRAADGTWSKASYTVDGLHATRGVYEYMGLEMGGAIPDVLATPGTLPASRATLSALAAQVAALTPCACTQSQ